MFFKRCLHNWEVITDKVTESTFEMSLRCTEGVGKIPHQLCQDDRKHILILKCTKCGKLDKTITTL